MLPFQGMGASLCPFPSISSSAGVQGPLGDFRIPGLLGAARGRASNSPKEFISIRSHGPHPPPAPRTARSPCLHPSSLFTCPTLSRKWKGLQAPSKSPLGGGPRESLLLPPQCLGLLLLPPEAIHTSEPQRNATVLWNPVFKDRAWGRGHLCSTFPDFRVRDSRRHPG